MDFIGRLLFCRPRDGVLVHAKWAWKFYPFRFQLGVNYVTGGCGIRARHQRRDEAVSESSAMGQKCCLDRLPRR
jgi:hypothetical protein